MRDSVAWLYGLQTHGIKLGLTGIRSLLALLDHHEDELSIVLVGGTNGKGSVAAMLDAMLAAAGRRSGLYTSPHLVRPEERIRIAGADIDSRVFDEILARVRDAAERLPVHPSFFEVMTAAALVAFREAKVGDAVLEVGLGGRLDATNATEPRVSAIVTVDLDHVAILGGTLPAIAAEKAEIARAGRPLVSGIEQEEAIAVVRSHCAAIGATFLDARDAPLPEPVDLALAGEHQRANARVAVATFCAYASAAGFPAAEGAIRRGLASARWPGRLQRLAGAPEMLLDGAHNAAGAEALARYLAARPGPRPVLVFAAMADKDAGAILSPLVPHVAAAVMTRPPVERAAEPGVLAGLARRLGLSAEARTEPLAAIARAREVAGPEGTVLVAGSLYLIGAVLALLEGPEAPGPISM
ncbi:MAG TPA: cyanophycin synthetase [Candidatus Polarisedimenticolaceae bacterium]|nr:cyanophycin synthetase [Candidatus Polarisedimenticolaceae bacterium]